MVNLLWGTGERLKTSWIGWPPLVGINETHRVIQQGLLGKLPNQLAGFPPSDFWGTIWIGLEATILWS